MAAGPQVTISEQHLFAGSTGQYYTEESYRSSPVVVDLDGDGKYEVLLNTTYYALCAYKLNVTGAPAVVTPPVTTIQTAYARSRTITVNGTSAQFGVTWDGAVNLQSETAYQLDGSEMSTPFSGDWSHVNATADAKVDGTVAGLEVILLQDDAGAGYTYYKLRDLGDALGFAVGRTAEDGITVTTP